MTDKTELPAPTTPLPGARGQEPGRGHRPAPADLRDPVGRRSQDPATSRGEFTGSERIARVLERHPTLTLVIAHAGMPEYHEFADLVERFDHVHLDTTMVATEFTERFAPLPPGFVDRLGELGDRVVLGSDFPNIPYPYAHQIDSLARLGLGDDWMRAVLWHNGARLMG